MSKLTTFIYFAVFAAAIGWGAGATKDIVEGVPSAVDYFAIWWSLTTIIVVAVSIARDQIVNALTNEKEDS